LDAYARYIATERRAKFPDLSVIKVLYERAIAEAAKRRYNGEPGAEAALRLFWVGYCDSLVILMIFLPEMNAQFLFSIRGFTMLRCKMDLKPSAEL
jgi:hypothetical protein